MESDDCVIEDSSEMMAVKIMATLARQGPAMQSMVARHARESRQRLTRRDRAFVTALYPLSRASRMATGEYLLPRAIIHNDESALATLRARIDECLVAQQRDVPNACETQCDNDISFAKIPELIDAQIDYDEFKRRVAGLGSYAQLHAAHQAMDDFIAACEAVAARSCAYRCGAFGAEKHCSACENFYCSDACFDGHVELSQCTATTTAAAAKSTK
jgi:hypothetical protein